MKRRKLGDRVAFTVPSALCAVAGRMFGEFQSERLVVQAGENIGRSLAEGSDPKGIAKRIMDFIREANLGSAEFEKGEKKERYEGIGVFRVAESMEAFCPGKPSKPACNMIRGLIRGAYSAVYRQENIAVRENKCIALGAEKCEFEAYWVPM